ncbi:alpha/beta fold hydrolase [Nonomuraea phyllanthi]|uniref:Alpha/beta fold hydrolase n=1 Tax=Nonomuraea phyllanthi TaxID=2219224 RepID=A0A5C4W9C7_9ACTN|nr:alpha/beta fold hydrolase [Nonomuraea phyllanthi]KAB8192714.1 alpha/beta fold hydrolase [Nonomuraea phyllanthi]
MERRLYVLAASAFIVAAVLGSAWITGQFTTPEVDRTDGYVGELAARDQPWTGLFRVSDALSGLACAGGVALVPRVAREWRGWLALAAFGLLTLAAAIFPLDCATLSDPSCGRRALSSAHYVHLATGALGTAAVLAAMALLSARWRSWVSWLFTSLGLLATVLVVGAYLYRHGVGLAHRAQLTVFAVWLVYAALRLLVSDDVPGCEPPCGNGTSGGPSPGLPPPAGNGGSTRDGRPEGDPGPAGNGRSGEGSGPGGNRGSEMGPGSGGTCGCDGGPHVVEQGSGPAVLIAAGLGGAWFHWDAVAGRLATSHRVIRFDRPGLGLSPCSPDPPSLYREAARLAALAPAHPEQVIVVAQGMGCWYAEAFARLHPLCVAGLVLVDPARVPERGPLALAASAGRWLPSVGCTWGATALARLVGPSAHRLLTGLSDPYGVYRAGRVHVAVAGEWVARRDMAAELLRMRADRPLPEVPVTVVGTGTRKAPGAADFGTARFVRLPGSRRRTHLRHAETIAVLVLDTPPPARDG